MQTRRADPACSLALAPPPLWSDWQHLRYPRPVRMKSRKLAAIAALLVLAALAAWLLWPRAVPVETILVQRAPAVRTLAVNGTIRPRLSVEVQSPVPAR